MPQQCTVAFGSSLLHTVTDGCPMAGMAVVHFSADETWIGQKVTVPGHAYAAILDGNPATDATLSVRAWSTSAVVPDSRASADMWAAGNGGRRLEELQEDDKEQPEPANEHGKGLGKKRAMQAGDSCELLGCDVQTVEAQLEIPLLRDDDGLPTPVGEFTPGGGGDRDSPGTFRSADGAGGGVTMAQGGGITIDATDIGLGAGWLLFLLLVVALLGKRFATRKAKRKAKRAEKKKAAEEGV
eukprot:COSAG04_NODE_4143_length_2273_cov_1.343146_2_plen_241_part_00